MNLEEMCKNVAQSKIFLFHVMFKTQRVLDVNKSLCEHQYSINTF